jgi:predicted acetyltransferase
VATQPDAQCYGYAEAVMRHSLAEASKATGLQRSILHATDSGRSIYLRMGYRDTARFTGYVSM